MVDLSVVCTEIGKTGIDCAREIAPNFKGIFIMFGAIIFTLLVIRLIFATVKTKQKKFVFWVGFVFIDVLIMVIMIIFYFLIPNFLVWFKII